MGVTCACGRCCDGGPPPPSRPVSSAPPPRRCDARAVLVACARLVVRPPLLAGVGLRYWCSTVRRGMCTYTVDLYFVARVRKHAYTLTHTHTLHAVLCELLQPRRSLQEGSVALAEREPRKRRWDIAADARAGMPTSFDGRPRNRTPHQPPHARARVRLHPRAPPPPPRAPVLRTEKCRRRDRGDANLLRQEAAERPVPGHHGCRGRRLSKVTDIS